MRRENPPGFSMIELMIVIAIIGILAAAAIPSYTRYLARSRISEVFGLLNSIEPKLVEFHGATGNFPAVSGTADPLGLSIINSIYIKNVAITASNSTSAKITATINNTVFGFPDAVQLYLMVNAPSVPGGTYPVTCMTYAPAKYIQYFPASCPQDPAGPT